MIKKVKKTLKKAKFVANNYKTNKDLNLLRKFLGKSGLLGKIL